MQVWELVICDPERSFEYAQYYPNNKVNSGEVGARFFLPVFLTFLSKDAKRPKSPPRWALCPGCWHTGLCPGRRSSSMASSRRFVSLHSCLEQCAAC